MTASSTPGTDALEPLRGALLSRARTEVEAIGSKAAADARRLLDDAAAQAAELVAQARAQGEADAARLAAAGHARTRRAARDALLAAQREAYEELRARCCVAVAALLADPDRRRYLVGVVDARLGVAAATRRWSEGNLHAELPDGRTVDASVPALVDAALATLDLEQLWTAS